MSDAPITFYLPKEPDLAKYDVADPDTDWTLFRTARDQWIPQTYVRLRQAGHPVTLSNTPPQTGVVVVFAGDMRRFLGHQRALDDLTVVCATADRRVSESRAADIIVQHNGHRADGRRRVFVPNWPQTGLVRRDINRGTALRNIHYKGNIENLRTEFLSPNWTEVLQRRGLRLVLDADVNKDLQDRLMALSPYIRIGSPSGWNDYRTTDVVLAVRPHRRDLYRHKPAAKLVNAWHAGVPAILGPEFACRELRRSDHDYLEADSPSAVEAALTRLSDRSFFETALRNGAQRAAEYSVANITRMWEDVFALAATTPGRARVSRVYLSLAIPATRAFRGATTRRLPQPRVRTP